MPRFVVAARRDADIGAAALRDLLAESGGLTVTGDSNPLRLVVEGEDEAAVRLRERHLDTLIVERVILHGDL